MKKLLRSMAAMLLFLVILAFVYYIHISYFKVDVVFYAAIADGIAAALITGACLFFLKPFGLLSNFEKFQLIVILLLGGYAFAISVPTVIDRSLSFYILEKLHQRGGGIRQDAFQEVFTQEYVIEHRLVDVRLTEQVRSGTIEILNGCVLLTKKGEIISDFSRYFRQHLLPKKRLLLGQYTDALTDPFRDSKDVSSYECAK